MKLVYTLWDAHPGKWHHGKKVVLCMATIMLGAEVIDQFLTCVRANPVETFGMFGDKEGPIQVCRFDKGRLVFTMSNYGSIPWGDEFHLISSTTPVSVIIRQPTRVITISRIEG